MRPKTALKALGQRIPCYAGSLCRPAPSPHSCGHSLSGMGLREPGLQNLSGPAGGSHNPASPGGIPCCRIHPPVYMG